VTSPQTAYNILVSDSVVVLDCRDHPPSDLTGSVRSEGVSSQALLSAYELCISDLCPDNPKIVLIVADNASQTIIEAAEVIRKRCNRCLLVDGLDRVFPFLFGTSSLPVYPNQISERIYLGSAFMLKPSLLDDLKITHVLSVLDREISPPFGRKHLRLDIVDGLDADLRPVLRSAIPFLEAVTGSSRVLVHCEQGVSRSVSVVVAFLMRQGMSLAAALEHVRACRPSARPNENFMRQLKLLETQSSAFYES